MENSDFGHVAWIVPQQHFFPDIGSQRGLDEGLHYNSRAEAIEEVA
jgi:hypothetical protein